MFSKTSVPEAILYKYKETIRTATETNNTKIISIIATTSSLSSSVEKQNK
jgi:hypothetical protein